MTEKLVPTEADREMAAKIQWLNGVPNKTVARYRAGELDNEPLIQGLAQHAAAARAEGMERAAKIAESHSDDRPYRDSIDWNDAYQDACRNAAAAIRAGASA